LNRPGHARFGGTSEAVQRHPFYKWVDSNKSSRHSGGRSRTQRKPGRTSGFPSFMRPAGRTATAASGRREGCTRPATFRSWRVAWSSRRVTMCSAAERESRRFHDTTATTRPLDFARGDTQQTASLKLHRLKGGGLNTTAPFRARRVGACPEPVERVPAAQPRKRPVTRGGCGDPPREMPKWRCGVKPGARNLNGPTPFEKGPKYLFCNRRS